MEQNYTNTPHTILELAQVMKQIGKEGLAEEFAKLPLRNPKGSFLVSKMANNLKRNRVPVFITEDSSLVPLSVKSGEGESASNFINANFVDGYNKKNEYIATQGPLSSTASDFWQMIWDQECLVIVMTTGVVEGGVEKCHLYWERNAGDSAVYGNFVIKTTLVETNEGYTVSALEIKNEKTNETRKVSHLFYYAWPDFGVPSSSKALVKYVLQVRDTQASMLKTLGSSWTGHPLGPPIVVHCSAGIGRTGAFILIDISIYRLEIEGVVDLIGTLMAIRDQRPFAIGMPSQFTFCHRALIEYAIDRGLLNIDITLEDFDDNKQLDVIHLGKLNEIFERAWNAMKNQPKA